MITGLYRLGLTQISGHHAIRSNEVKQSFAPPISNEIALQDFTYPPFRGPTVPAAINLSNSIGTKPIYIENHSPQVNATSGLNKIVGQPDTRKGSESNFMGQRINSQAYPVLR